MNTFKDRLDKLEEISGKLKDGDIPLEEAVSLFEEGMKLSFSLEKDLSKIERKVEILINNPVKPEDEPRLELFPELKEEE